MGGILLLEDGRSFSGQGFGAQASLVGEIVFNTAMTGYQEVLTDPSYREQIVAMTVPHVGNTGVNTPDQESAVVHPRGMLARSFSKRWSNHRAEGGLDRYLRTHGVPGLDGVDTRALVRHIRQKGAMKAVISTDGKPAEELFGLLESWPGMAGRALAVEVSTPKVYTYADPESPTWKVNVLDGGCKQNILRLFAQTGARVRVYPALTPAAELAQDADAVFVSNGPGDPAALPEMKATLQSLVGEIPLLGICLGHQLLALALGAETYKLAFGHRGANHPVKDLVTGKVEVTSQNHGFCVTRESLEAVGAQVTHVNLNDKTVAGFVHADKRVMGIQYHPEAAPGPHDAQHLLLERFATFAGHSTRQGA